jgi:hypothetical protein
MMALGPKHVAQSNTVRAINSLLHGEVWANFDSCCVETGTVLKVILSIIM